MDNNEIEKKVCELLNLKQDLNHTNSIENFIKKATVKKLCEVVGLTGKYNHESPFFKFFSNIMGEAVCEVLNIKIRIACDEVRLFKYSGINLVEKAIDYLKTESVEEAFLDVFEMADQFKFLVDKISLN